MSYFFRHLLTPLTLAALTACTQTEPSRAELEPSAELEQSGRLLALSGGDAGATGACITCHGLQGEGNGGDAPRLAGLNAGYVVRQIDNFSSGQRRHPSMVWIADQIDWPDRVRLGEYYMSLPVPDHVPGANPIGEIGCSLEAVTLYQEGDADRGLPSCASCHGPLGQGSMGVPPLTKQPAPYLALQLEHWRNGERYGDPQMLAISRLLTDEEVQALAGYSAALRDASPYPGLPAACLPERRPDPRSGA